MNMYRKGGVSNDYVPSKNNDIWKSKSMSNAPKQEDEELRKKLRNIVARSNTGYDYETLQKVVQEGEELLDQEEIDEVDKTVNELGHFIKAYSEQKALKELEGVPVREEENEWDAVDILRDIEKHIATRKAQLTNNKEKL